METVKDETIIGYAVKRMVPWPSAARFMGREVLMETPAGQVGYLPVYATLAALLADWPDETGYLTIRREEVPS